MFRRNGALDPAKRALRTGRVGVLIVAILALVAVGAISAFWVLKRGPKVGEQAGHVPQSADSGKPVQIEATLPTDAGDSWSEIDDPSADGWETESFAQAAGDQLDLLKKMIVSGNPVTVDKLARVAADDVRSTALQPRKLLEVSRNSDLQVQRGDFEQRPTFEFDGLKGLANALGTVAAPLPESESVRRRMKFKIFRVHDAGTTMTTRQYVEFVEFGSDRITENHATWKIDWRKGAEGTAPLIAAITLEEFEQAVRETGQTLFSDCTESVFGGDASYPSQIALGANYWLGRGQDSEANSQMGVPGIAVADVNGDGLDDLYLCQNGGLPNRLFLQREDGGVREASAEWGVDWLDASRGVLLVDLDNDGDKDLVVATVGNLVIAENINQRGFEVKGALPVGDDTTSLSAVDYDQDGLLDLFCCVYRHDVVSQGGRAEVMVNSGATFVQHDATNGGPNSLFRNVGAFSFKEVTEEVGLAQNNTRYSFAGAWEDFDNDGDLDLYVANDYGRNNLYRNDAGANDGRMFTDMAAGSVEEDSAFGMAVTWGDYDRDGWMDIYVSNMWSAAGNRVTFQDQFKANVPEVKKRLQQFAQGNSLLRNRGDGSFEAVANASGAAIGRWAWGTRFVDINNDGWEDLVVANGFMTTEDSGDL